MYNRSIGTATIIESTIRNNSAKVADAICNGGLLTISRSTSTSNTALEMRAGTDICNCILHVANSTLSGNIAARGVGGAILQRKARWAGLRRANREYHHRQQPPTSANSLNSALVRSSDSSVKHGASVFAPLQRRVESFEISTRFSVGAR